MYYPEIKMIELDPQRLRWINHKRTKATPNKRARCRYIIVSVYFIKHTVGVVCGLYGHT